MRGVMLELKPPPQTPRLNIQSFMSSAPAPIEPWPAPHHSWCRHQLLDRVV